MAHRRLRSAGQPVALRLLLGLFEWLASSQLAVVLIAVSTVVLAWSAFGLDKQYGTKVVQFTVYGTWWFAGLNFLLGVNVLAAALIRFPWKKHQTGFVVTHAGIIVLLLGCLLTRAGGIDAQLPVMEESASHLAFEDTQHFELSERVAQDPEAEARELGFSAGPFNWDDYSRLVWFPWRLAHRDRGVLYDEGGVKLDVLDYYSDSRLLKPRPLKLRVKAPPKTGEPKVESGEPWQSMDLNVERVEDPNPPHDIRNVGGFEELPGGAQVAFWVAGNRAETDAFLDSRPEGPLGTHGQLVIHAAGKKFPIAVDSLVRRMRLPLGDTGLQVELVNLEPATQAVWLRVLCPGCSPQPLRLWAEFPQSNQQDDENGVFATYWAASDRPPAKPVNAGDSPSPGKHVRIDILQGADRDLYYRVWRSPRVEAIGRLPTDGTRVDAMQNSDAPISFYVEQFTPHDRPGQVIRSEPFSKTKNFLAKQRQVRLRLTVDGTVEEFWLEGMPMILDPGALPDPYQRKVVHANGRHLAVTLPWDQVDVGFAVYLHKFTQRLDAGTSMPSHFSSLVDCRELEPPQRTLQEKVLITMNAPADFADPQSGRSYRLFQESRDGPYRPGDPRFDKRVKPGSQRDELWLSLLTVNYDPGRGLKYAGSLLIIAGVATMYYMRAYFFRRRRAAGEISE